MNRDDIQNALDRLRAQGEYYVKSDDVAEHIDEEITRGKRGHIGRIMNRLAEEGEDIELWGGDRRSMTWRIQGGKRT